MRGEGDGSTMRRGEGDEGWCCEGLGCDDGFRGMREFGGEGALLERDWRDVELEVELEVGSRIETLSVAGVLGILGA